MKKHWVQVAIDTKDIETARKFAACALKAGAGWIEAGTPLIVYEGIQSIGELVKVSGTTPVIADFKGQDGVYKYFSSAAELGAKYAVVLGCMPDGSVLEAVRAKKENGIQVVCDMLSVRTEDLVKRAKELEALGVDFIMVHLGFDESKYDKVKQPFDGVKELSEAISLPIGVGVFTTEEACRAIELGASWVVQGEPMLSAPDSLEQLTELVRAVEKYN